MRQLALAFLISTQVAATAGAAVIFQTVDPGATDINTLAETLAGAHESNTVDAKNVFDWGLVVPVTQDSTLRTAVAPFNVGPTTGLRLDVFEVPYPVPHLGITNKAITTSFVYLGSSSVIDGLGAGRQWVTFSFADLALTAGKYYLFRASPDNTNAAFVAQQHYWLGTGTVGNMLQDIRYFLPSSVIPANTLGESVGDTTIQSATNDGGLYLTDVSSVPEPASLVLLALGAGVLSLRRRRA